MRRAVIAMVIGVMVAWPLVAAGKGTPTATPPIVDAAGFPADACETPVVAGAGRAFSGGGHALIDVGRLDEGVYVVHGVYDGDGNWTVTLTGRKTANTEFPILLEPAPFDDRTVMTIYDFGADAYLMEVDASGPWRVEIGRA